MIRKTFIWLTLILPLVLFGQNKMLLSGNIKGHDDGEVILHLDKYYTGEPENLTAKLKGGKFEFQIQLDRPGVHEIEFNKEKATLYLEPGTDLNIEVGFAGFAIPLFSGPGAANNDLYAEFSEKFKDQFTFNGMKPKIFGTGVDLYEMELFQNRNAHYDFVKAFKSEAGSITPTFREFIRGHINFNYFRWLLGYAIEISNQATKEMFLRKLPPIMTEELAMTKVDLPELLGSPAYRGFVIYHVTYFTSQDKGFKKFSDMTESVNSKSTKADALFGDQVFAWYLADLLLDNCDKITENAFKKLMVDLKSAGKGTPYVEQVNTNCADKVLADVAVEETADKGKKKKKKRRGKKEPGKHDEVVLTDLDGNEVVLSDFEGKVVYIDFWASWCGPCRAQFPAAKALKERFSDKEMKDLVFLYISIDDKEQAWRSAIEKYDIHGTHTRSSGGWRSKACSYFRITSIPRYMLINKDGEIVQSSAKRPSMQGIFEDIKNLLAE